MSIKLVYEKYVEEDGKMVRHLFGSETGIPAEDDAQLEYVPAFSADQHIFFYTKSAEDNVRTMGVNASKRQLPADDDVEMTASCNGTDVINNIGPDMEEKEEEKEEEEEEEPEVEPEVKVEPEPEVEPTEENPAEE